MKRLVAKRNKSPFRAFFSPGESEISLTGIIERMPKTGTGQGPVSVFGVRREIYFDASSSGNILRDYFMQRPAK